MTMRLFDNPSTTEPSKEELAPGAFLLRGFALPDDRAEALAVQAQAATT
jgi:hypothetical protein